MRRWRSLGAAGLAVLLPLAVAACGGDGDGDRDAPAQAASGDDASAATSTTLDPSPFCVTIRSLEALGSEPSSAPATPAEVLAQNASVISLLDEATASAPADAPADVQALFDDYSIVSEAVAAASGDTAAAYAALSRDDPELTTRLSAHDEAFAFFAQRCGTAPPTKKG